MGSIRIFALCWTALLLVVAAVHAEQPDVLVINSYHAGYSWVDEHNAALAEGLAGRASLTFFDMDTKRLPVDRFRERADAAFAEYERIRPQVVVLTDDNALQLLGDRIAAAGTAVVYLGVNSNPRNYLHSMHLVTGVLQRPLFKRSVAYLLRIYGKRLQRCLVLLDSGTTSQVVLNQEFSGKQHLSVSGISIDIRLVKRIEQWRGAVLGAAEAGYDVIILGLYHTLTNAAGEHVPAEEVSSWTSTNTPLPLFAFAKYAVGRGKAIGGLVYEGRSQGELAAGLVRRVLDGEVPEDILPITDRKGVLIFSRHELERWGVELPQGLAPQDQITFVD